MQKLLFTTQEKKIFAGCFFSYLLCYMARMNLSAALPSLSSAMQLNETQAGLLQTVFAMVYASGQLLNGLIADHVSARRHVVTGLLLTALCNLLFGLSNAYWQLLLFWALNGAAQSMLWTPIVHLIAAWFTGKKRSLVSFFMCLCFIIGHLLAWGVSGLLAAYCAWRASFFSAAGITLGTALFAFCMLRDRQIEKSAAAAQPPMKLGKLLFGTGLCFVCLACICTGFVRDGVTTWAPTLIGARFAANGASSVALSLLVPLMNLLGLLLGQYLLARCKGGLLRVIFTLLAGASAFALLLTVYKLPAAAVFALLLGILCSLLYSVSNMLNVMLPLAFESTGRVSFIAGLCDCTLYLGASLTGVISGALMQGFGLQAMFLCWTLCVLLSILFMALFARQRPTLT